MTRLAAAAALALAPAAAGAYRPFDGTDAAVAERAEVEVEVGSAWLRRGPERSLFLPSLVVNWGFAERWEAVVEGKQGFRVDGHVVGPRYRLEGIALDLKAVLRPGTLQGKAGPSVAAEIGALLTDSNGEAGPGAQAALIASQSWPALTVHLGAQAGRTRARVLGLGGSLIAEGPGSWAVRPVAEALVEGERSGPVTRSVLVGAIWRVREGLALDAALRAARAGREAEAEVRAGLTLAFPAGFPR